MNTLFMEFELDMMKNDHIFESESDRLEVSALEIANLQTSGYLTESEDGTDILEEAVGKYIEAVKNFFKTIKEKIQKLINDIKKEVALKIVQHEVSKKLSEFKKKISSGVADIKKKTVSLFDTAKYTIAYKKFTNDCAKSLRELYSKEYKTVDECTAAYDKCMKRIADSVEKNHITDFDYWEIVLDVDKALAYTESEIKSYKSVCDVFEKAQQELLDDMESLATKVNDSTKISQIKATANKVTSIFTTVVKKVVKSPINKVNAIGIAIGVAIGISENN